MRATAPVTILLVEDDEIDVMALQRAFRSLKIANPVVRALDGIEALDYLKGTNGKPRVPEPTLVLLDLNLPRMGGIEFLEALRQDPALDTTVVFVMTTSADEEDRISAYRRHVAGYVLKHHPAKSFLDAVNMLHSFWRIIEFPMARSPSNLPR